MFQPLSKHAIREIETHALSSWPALSTQELTGWSLRLAKGHTKRSNSVTPLSPIDSDLHFITRCEAIYRQHDLPCIFRITPLCPDGFASGLLRRGYTETGRAITMVAPTKSLPRSPALHAEMTLQVSRSPTTEWTLGFSEASSLSDNGRIIHSDILDRIPYPTAFITHDSTPSAWAYATCSEKRIGIFDVVVHPTKRGLGLGKGVMRGLMEWGAENGADEAYLFVEEGNVGARRLYEGLGFREVYRYYYMVKQVA